MKDHLGRTIDFGKTAQDYATHRPDFPESLWDRLFESAWLRPGDRALDLGTGTGAVARALARSGLSVVGVDVAPEMVRAAEDRARAEHVDARFSVGRAEATGQADGAFDVVTAGQCWWWFNANEAAREARRVLAPGGRLLIVSFCYLPSAGSVAEASERLILAHNSGWKFSGTNGLFPEQVADLERAGFVGVETFSYDLEVPFTRVAWRGRVRACNGVAATLSPEEVAAFDAELAALLDKEPEPLSIRHRVYAALGRRP